MSVSSMKYSRDVYIRTIIDTANLVGDSCTAFVPGDDGKRACHLMLMSGGRVLWKSSAFLGRIGRAVVCNAGLGLKTFFFPEYRKLRRWETTA